MKTFRMIVLAVIAAIAIGGLTVDAFRCKKDEDCTSIAGEKNSCVFNVMFGDVKVGDDTVGICSVEKTFMDENLGKDGFLHLLGFVEVTVLQTDELWSTNRPFFQNTFNKRRQDIIDARG
eukprot:GHVS01002423.1.p1 GENE.GHVS01002423.1~~GHVS01002423.1.p1  ORF type:complete len:120 (-),score=12.23 GHVS01002423.1:303-662(-)